MTEFGSIRTGTVIGNNSDVDDRVPYGGYYTQDEAREIVAYAAERHITVIPEVDMPGHMMAALSEVAWTNESQKDFERFKARLNRLVLYYEFKGWTYAKHVWPEKMGKERWKI